MSKKKPLTGGIISNLDKILSPRESSKIERDEKYTEILDRAINADPDYRFGGELGRNSAVAAVQEKWSASDIRARRDAGDKIIPAFIRILPDGDYQWILTDADEEACRQGYVCPNCLEWQRFPNLPKCESLHGFSCGYRGGM